MEIEARKEIPSQVNRFQVDEMRDINIIEWNKKRKLQGFQLDLIRPKHKCRVESSSSSSQDESMIDESSILESANNHTVNSRMDDAFLDDRSEHQSAKDSNSFIEDSDTSMSVNDDSKLEADSANTYLCVDRLNYSEDETFIDSDDTDIQDMDPEQLRRIYSEYLKESSEFVKESSDDQSIDTELVDLLLSHGLKPDKDALSSGIFVLNQEPTESSVRPPTIDEEFEEYFSALML